MTAEDLLDRLLALQQMDMELASLEARAAELPERRAGVTREVTELERERAAIVSAQEASRLIRRQKESEVELLREKLARYEHQLNEVKTNVAYSALLSEIQRTKREIAQLEDEVLERMAEREEQDGRLAEIDGGLTEKRAALAGAVEALDAEEQALEEEMKISRHRRALQAEGVDPQQYRLYDRLRRARRFPALVPLRGQACGACHGSMPPQVVREITHGRTLHVCENCGSLVYVATETQAAGAGADRS